MNKSLYDILEIEKSASNEQIKKAYRKMAFKYHPDRNQDSITKSEIKMKQITHAYYVLGDVNRKANYDNRKSTASHDFKYNASFEDWYKNFKQSNDHELIDALSDIVIGMVLHKSLIKKRRTKSVGNTFVKSQVSKLFSFITHKLDSK